MADVSISGNMKIKTLKNNFNKAFGSILRVYNGVKFADDEDTVGKIAKKPIKRGEDISIHGRSKVSTLEKQMKETYDIKVQVAKSDDSGLVDNDLTLTQSGK